MPGTLSNFAACGMWLIFRPFRVGDLVEMAGTLGVVEEIGILVIPLQSPAVVRRLQ